MIHMKILALFAAVLMISAMGCTGQAPGPLVGNDSDAHGCKPSAGYSWCEAKQKCLRIWEEPCEGKLTSNQAISIAASGECNRTGELSGNLSYNNNTKTWWIDLVPNEPKPGCSPACVVFEENSTSEVNWRCTGAIPPQ